MGCPVRNLRAFSLSLIKQIEPSVAKMLRQTHPRCLSFFLKEARVRSGTGKESSYMLRAGFEQRWNASMSNV